jgi:SAM-dependent methyltransferase
MGEPAGWQRRVQEFVLGQIGDPPARVLEVGCGKGQLARALARVGHSVTAIDPRAPEGPIFRSVGIEEFSDAEPFDHVVASLSLHHLEDLGRALDKVVDSLRPGGTLVVVEFAWDRIDEATAEWALGRLPATPPSGEHSSWLERCWRGRACGGEGGDHDHENHTGAHFAEWAEQGLHDSGRMRAELERRFVEDRFEWVPYLYPDLDETTSEADERAAIDAGAINATGFRYVGVLGTEGGPSAGALRER